METEQQINDRINKPSLSHWCQTELSLRFGGWTFRHIQLYADIRRQKSWDALRRKGSHFWADPLQPTIDYDVVGFCCPICRGPRTAINLHFYPDGSVTDCHGRVIDPFVTSICKICQLDLNFFLK